MALVTHGDIARMLIGHLSGAPLDAFQRIVIDTASVSVVSMDGAGRAYVHLVNETGGLDRFGKGAAPPWERVAAGGTDAGQDRPGSLRG